MAHKYGYGDHQKPLRSEYQQDSKKYIPSQEIGEYEHYKKRQVKKGGQF